MQCSAADSVAERVTPGRVDAISSATAQASPISTRRALSRELAGGARLGHRGGRRSGTGVPCRQRDRWLWAGSAGSEKTSQKVLWVASPNYIGLALIRGRRLDDSTDVHFERSTPPTDLRFPLDTGILAAGSDQGWRYLASTVLVPGIGCYGFQIDAPEWTITVVMRGEAN